jgi:hypothetical protein
VIRRTALAAVLVLGFTSGCGLFSDDKKPPPPAEAKCAGQDSAGSIHVLQSGPGPLPGGGRAVLTESNMDANPPTGNIALLGTDPGESTRADVKVGDVVTVKAKKYSVVQVCSDSVSLLAQQ